ncbi:MAG: hypothetical protein JWQ68_2214, partial [Cryobacterium sp.]|nr:hypothetical protein [Cryobacterium sp.]
VLIVEGVKQALAAHAWAPDNWSIYRITGIWSWLVAGDAEDIPSAPTTYLSLVQGCKVVIVPDADAATKIAVFDGATALGKACEAYGATSVKFARLPGAGKDGVDDLLARLADDAARRNMLHSWVTNAKPKPADLDMRRQKSMRAQLSAERRAKATEASQEDSDSRIPVNVGRDMLQVVLDLVDALNMRRGGVHVFHRSNELVRLRRGDGKDGAIGALRIESLGQSGLRRELLEAVRPFTETPRGPEPAALTNMIVDLVADHYDQLPRLSGITRSPIVLRDGIVLTASGFHAQSGMFLDLTQDVEGIAVPEHPTDADIAEATSLIRDDLFAMDGAGGTDGWVFASEADQTNAIAGLLTPLVRQNVSKAPALLFDGLQRGVGKGECVEIIHRTAFGTPAPIQPTPTTDEEMDKRLTAKLRAGADTIVLDEVQNKDGSSRLDSNSLSAFLTSVLYEGRKLGASEILSSLNLATVFGTGNNIQIPGDMIRRVYTSRLSSDRPDLETRDNFRHDLDTWVPEHRGELLRACLIMIRAWYDRDQPDAPKTFGFKSFTEWQRVIGGILHLAGIRGFLSTVLEVRDSADSEAVDNAEHWRWVELKFPAGTRFAASEVLAQAKADPDAPPPYGVSWDGLDGRKLSMLYGRNPRWYADIRIREDGKVHGGAKAYVVEHLPAGVAVLPSAALAPSPVSVPAGPRPAAGTAPGELIEFTGRGGFKQQAARAMPPMNGKTIAELGGDAS